MLTVYELDALCECLGLSREARGVIETIRSSPPMRRVRSAAGNVSVRYPSRKMGVTIQAESHRVELAGLYEYEHDAQVLEFFEKPPAVKLIYHAANGRPVSVWHTPDYFVLRSGVIRWEEWKTEAGLERLAERCCVSLAGARDGEQRPRFGDPTFDDRAALRVSLWLSC